MDMKHTLFVHNMHKDKELGLRGLLFCIKETVLGPETLLHAMKPVS